MGAADAGSRKAQTGRNALLEQSHSQEHGLTGANKLSIWDLIALNGVEKHRKEEERKK